ncbi:discoidin domain-containing protein [Agaribacterium sp. ZY112]|uniref:galactose-binding domain-containing protein n=1 Tax=Agaribacterium sp. ZY112 TaxID=3233574 RepID=UPI00352452F3
MKPITKYLCCLCLAVLSFPSWSWDGATDTNSWQQLRTSVQSKRSQLQSLLDRAEGEGLDVARARVSLETIDLFYSVTEWDFNNQDVLQEYTEKWPVSQVYSANDYKKIPFEQLEDCLEIANYAINELNRQLSNELRFTRSVDLYSGHKIIENGNFTQDGKAVFPYSVIGGISSEYNSFGGHMSSYHYLNQLLSNLNPATWIKNRAVERVTTANQDFLTPYVQFHGHAGALRDWMLDGPYDIVEAYSPRKIYKGGRNFVNYDINNPHIQGWLKALNTVMASSIADANDASNGPPVIHILANEPHFSVRENGWRVDVGGFTENMENGFREWLKNKYGTIANLNRAHRTNYSSFDQYSFSFPVAESLQGSPQYFELISYNLDRVNHFFTTQANTVKGQDPSALMNIKLLGGTLVSNMAGGIDFEYLTNLMDVTGSDFESTPDSAVFVGNSPDRIATDSWLANYSFYWSIGTQFLDYTKSLKPNAPHYNSEWHGFDTGGWRDLDMSRDYVNASFWTHHAHGLDFTEAWAWLREEDGKLKEAGAIGGLSTLPVALDQFGRTMREINNHAEAVAAIAGQERFAHVYLSRDSAIQTNQMNKDGQIVYEALKLLNYDVGVATKNNINELDPAKDFIVIPPTEFLSLQEINRLKSFQNSGGRLIAYERSGEPFAMKNELGISRSASNISPYRKLAFSGNPFAMADELESLTEDRAPAPVIPYETYNGQNLARRGILIKQALNESTGHVDIFLVNVSKYYLTADFSKTEEGQSWDFFDQINGVNADRKVLIKPMGVHLLRATSADGSNSGPSDGDSVNGTNLALNKPATQSSNYNNNFPASKAVDGLSTGDAGDFNHTLSEANPWWQVDLGAVSTISTIEIYNRTNCCSNRLSNFHVLVSDVPFTSTNLNSSMNQAGVGNYHVAGQAGSPSSLNINRTGRYVRVQLAGTGILNIAEVVVNGSQSQVVHMKKRNASSFAMDGRTGGANNQNVHLWSASLANVNQNWNEINRGGGYFSYQKLNTNYCLDGGNGGANGQNVILWTCSDSNQNQHWRKVSVGADSYRLEKRNAAGFSIDGGNSGASGQNVYLWASNDNNQNQHWTFSNSGSGSGGSNPSVNPTTLTIQADSFRNTGGSYDDASYGGLGIGVSTTGGAIHFVNGGDWAEYEINVPASGQYEVVYSISTPLDGTTVQMSAGSSSVTTNVSNNGSWENYVELVASSKITLNAGIQTIRLQAGTNDWQWNMKQFTLRVPL